MKLGHVLGERRKSRTRVHPRGRGVALAIVAAGTALSLTACGDDDDEATDEPAAVDAGGELGAIKAYLTEHCAELRRADRRS